MEYAFPGDYPTCKNEGINGILTDGGYAEYVTLDFTGITKIPKELDPAQAPLFCSGVTTFVSQRRSNTGSGLKTLADAIEFHNTELHEEHGSSTRSCRCHPRSRWSWVSVSYRTAGELLSESEYLRFPFISHLGVQFAAKSGFKTVALSSSDSKKDLAKELGAHVYVDGSKEDQAEALNKLGGADLIMCTAPNADIIKKYVNDSIDPGTSYFMANNCDVVEKT
jgi:D-arabinose 1-dehydrogenase-like Zn-dependent alcohol dehydrogenase